MTDFADLVQGYHRFRDGPYQEQHERWVELAQKQSPKVLLIACSDSRVDPTMVFDASPGEIFVIRNVANLVPPFETTDGYHGVSAALEFAVTQLEVEEIVVMGHGSCGGVGAALSQAFADAKPGEGGFVSDWIGILSDARERVVDRCGTGPDAVLEMEHETVRVSIENLLTFPFVKERVEDGRLSLRGAYFAIKDGVLHVMDKDGQFQPQA